MKKISPYFGIVCVLFLSCLIAWRATGYGHASQVVAHREDLSLNEYPRWNVHQGSGGEDGPGRIEFFEKSGECGYVERLSKEVSPRFLIYLFYKDGGARKGVQPSDQTFVLIGGYESLETAMRVTEHHCKSK
jgi:hypothetical protein